MSTLVTGGAGFIGSNVEFCGFQEDYKIRNPVEDAKERWIWLIGKETSKRSTKSGR